MESTLSISKNDLAMAVGVFCGYGKGVLGSEKAWSTRQSDKVEDCLVSGVRQFYYPLPVDGSTQHQWSFLRPVTTLTLALGARSVTLPDDFGGLVDGVSLPATSSMTGRRKLAVTADSRVRDAYSIGSPSPTGPPSLVSVIPLKGTTLEEGQRWQLDFYPGADVAYTFDLAYHILADRLSGAQPWVYGGSLHSETVLESCLAIAEERIFDAPGVHAMKFRELLRGSIDADKRFRPGSLGYNSDRSDEMGRVYGGRGRGRDDGDLVTYV